MKWSLFYIEMRFAYLLPASMRDLGCPVITSNTTSLPEVSVDAAICINPLSLDSHVKAYETLYYDREIRENLIRKGIENTQRFSWEKNIHEIMAQIKCDTST